MKLPCGARTLTQGPTHSKACILLRELYPNPTILSIQKWKLTLKMIAWAGKIAHLDGVLLCHVQDSNWSPHPLPMKEVSLGGFTHPHPFCLSIPWKNVFNIKIRTVAVSELKHRPSHTVKLYWVRILVQPMCLLLGLVFMNIKWFFLEAAKRIMNLFLE